jgi:energy-coupling factor transporter ATP-binding protein EcfA2
VRIDSIDLIRFGHFANREIEFPLQNPDYHLVYGDNEAGKSTLLRGISGLLFGIPTRTPDAHSCKSSELRVGEAEILLDDSRRFAERVEADGGAVSLNVWAGLPHVFASNVGALAAAEIALGDIGDFVSKCFGVDQARRVLRWRPGGGAQRRVSG